MNNMTEETQEHPEKPTPDKVVDLSTLTTNDKKIIRMRLKNHGNGISPLLSRSRLAAFLGSTYGGNRDVYDVLGYKKNLLYNDMRARYDREHIAARIVDAPAAATWSNPPVVIPEGLVGENKRFLEIWDELLLRLEIFSKFDRADKASGIGEYGIIYIGLRAGGAVENPVSRKFKADDILFLSIFAQENAQVDKFVVDPTDSRFGEVETYTVNTGKQVSNMRSFSIPIHASRVIHLAEGLLEDEVFGLPRLQKVYNLFDDLAKVVGGSAEFYWRIADRGLHADINPDLELEDGDETALSTEINDYIHNQNRVIQTRGVTVKSLGAETADPRGPFANIIALISGATGIPQRVLMGSERGQLASSQDKASWNDKISERQRLYAEPRILRRFINTLINWNILPNIKYRIHWPVVFPQTEEERSVIAARISSSARNLATAKMQGGKVISDEEFRNKFLDLEDEADIPEDDRIMLADEEKKKQEQEEEEGSEEDDNTASQKSESSSSKDKDK